MLVADIHIHQLAREIQVPMPIVVPDPATKPTGDDQRLQCCLRGPGMEHVRAVELARSGVQARL
jgi:hypothetical protein